MFTMQHAERYKGESKYYWKCHHSEINHHEHFGVFKKNFQRYIDRDKYILLYTFNFNRHMHFILRMY